jgi:Tfp pilus assembly protein PilO
MTRKTRMLLSVVALVAIVAMAWFFLISPLRSDIATANTSIAQETTRLSAAQAKLKQAAKTRAEGRKNQAQLLELAKMVPQSTQVPSLLVQIQDLADQSGIQFSSMSPGDPNESGGFQIVPLQLQFTGSYFDLSDFAYRVEQLVAGPGRLLTVKSIPLKLGGSDTTGTTVKSGKPVAESPSLTVTMTLYAFSMDQAGQLAAAATGPTSTATDQSTSTSTVGATTSN